MYESQSTIKWALAGLSQCLIYFAVQLFVRNSKFIQNMLKCGKIIYLN